MSRRTARPPAGDCYDYVRRAYHVPAFIGVPVSVGGRTGVIVPARVTSQYVHVRLDGDTHARLYHPTDGLTYHIDAFAHQFVVSTPDGVVSLEDPSNVFIVAAGDDATR